MILTRDLVRAAVLAAWSSFLAWLWFSGRYVEFVGTRTEWVVPLGAVTLGVLSLVCAGSWVMRGAGSRAGRLEGLGALALLLPIALVLGAPNAQLGSFAASRRLSDESGVIRRQASSDRLVDFADIQFSSEDPEYAQIVGVRVGLPVDLTGFVVQERDGVDGAFRLGRFYVACCAADALPHVVRIVGGVGRVHRDAWLRVKGRLAMEGRAFVVDAASIEAASRPANPYLSAT
jgi:uncharacterized repeat protein (TIGR03943 family)